MATKLRDIPAQKQKLAAGHRACAGCGCAVALRQVMAGVDEDVVTTCATGCMEVVTTIYPYSAWENNFIHSAFENSAATISGIETAFRALKKRGKIPADKVAKFIAFGGDGGTFDIGLQALSGALERGHDFLYVCYNNEAYMNTGIQRSGATPHGAATSTTPAGKVIPGKPQNSKDLTAIVAAHHVPYLAQASIHNHADLVRKVRRALDTPGPSFLNVLASCNRGWRIKMEESIDICRMAVDSCYWPLFEVADGQYKLNYKPKEKIPVVDYMKPQGRFRHLFKKENAHILEAIQKEVDRRWEDLVKLESIAEKE